MLRYVYFGTNNLEQAIAFYEAALTPLGMQRCVTNDRDWNHIAAGWGIYEDGGARELGCGCIMHRTFMPPTCEIRTATRLPPSAVDLLRPSSSGYAGAQAQFGVNRPNCCQSLS